MAGSVNYVPFGHQHRFPCDPYLFPWVTHLFQDASIGGDGAMLDIGFQNLSRLMASGKPIRVMVLDT